MRNPEEKHSRVAFQENILRQFGDRLFHIHDKRTNGKIVPYDPEEIIGEAPSSQIPGQVVFEKKEINPPSPRLQAIIEAVRANNFREILEENKKRIVIIGTFGATGVTIGIGAYFILKSFIDKDPQTDITDK